MTVSTLASIIMEISEAQVDTRTIIVRAKRTKRQRIDDEIERELSSPSNLDDHEAVEFIAKCLLLLAQDGHTKSSGNNDYCNNAPTDIKFTSKKYLGDGKSGKYFYECKTCGKLFNSFQALGGHRASHKNPKSLYNEEITQHNGSLDDDDRSHFNIFPMPVNVSNQNFFKNKLKMHQCGHCVAKFTSGQALGGHMRKHRAFMHAANYVDSSSTTLGLAQDDKKIVDQTLDLTLKLDLNYQQ